MTYLRDQMPSLRETVKPLSGSDFDALLIAQVEKGSVRAQGRKREFQRSAAGGPLERFFAEFGEVHGLSAQEAKASGHKSIEGVVETLARDVSTVLGIQFGEHYEDERKDVDDALAHTGVTKEEMFEAYLSGEIGVVKQKFEAAI